MKITPNQIVSITKDISRVSHSSFKHSGRYLPKLSYVAVYQKIHTPIIITCMHNPYEHLYKFITQDYCVKYEYNESVYKPYLVSLGKNSYCPIINLASS